MKGENYYNLQAQCCYYLAKMVNECEVYFDCEVNDVIIGKVIDILTEDVQYIVRYQGGNNAGHTVVIVDKKYVLL